ncbi:ATP-binding cassette domain-containing protein [Williamsoniiplasma luminosum]|nr:ATP-binding cassette domain-containing protein [Williamsoniiplasma luminosum]
MSNSDAKLISSYNYQGKQSVDKNIKSLNTRLDKLNNVVPIYEFNKKIDFVFTPSLKQKNLLVIEKYNFSITNGDRILIYGKNGSGKTTLLNLINEMLIAKKP